mgnify:CR=1 FL=1
MSNAQNLKSLDITEESLSKYLMSRYPNREVHDFSLRLYKLVGELRGSCFNAIDKLHRILERTKRAANDFENENPRSQLVGNRYSAIEIVIISISLLDNDFFLSWPDVLDGYPPKELEEYRKLILPEADGSGSN